MGTKKRKPHKRVSVEIRKDKHFLQGAIMWYFHTKKAHLRALKDCFCAVEGTRTPTPLGTRS